MSRQGTIKRYTLIIEKLERNHFPAFEDLKLMMIEEGFSISVRTLQRDIEQIRNEFFNYKGGAIELTKDNVSGIASICLNHPQRKNSLSGAMMAQLTDVIAELEEWREVYNNFFNIKK